MPVGRLLVHMDPSMRPRNEAGRYPSAPEERRPPGAFNEAPRRSGEIPDRILTPLSASFDFNEAPRRSGEIPLPIALTNGLVTLQ